MATAKKIKEWKAGDNPAGCKVLVKTFEEKTASNGKNYISGTISDSSGVLWFKIWNVNPAWMEILEAGKVIEVVTGKVEEYKGNLSVVLLVAKKAPGEKIMNYVPGSYMDEDAIKERLMFFREQINADGIDLTSVFKTMEEAGILEKYLSYPAGISKHHAYSAGLITHSIEVCNLAMNNGATLRDNPLVKPDMGVLLTASLFHDIGKLAEYETDTTGMFTALSFSGELNGHHFMSANFVSKMFGNLIKGRRMSNLLHCILSHHGRLEWGAAVEPKTLEALILHQCDMLSSQSVFLQERLKEKE